MLLSWSIRASVYNETRYAVTATETPPAQVKLAMADGKVTTATPVFSVNRAAANLSLHDE